MAEEGSENSFARGKRSPVRSIASGDDNGGFEFTLARTRLT